MLMVRVYHYQLRFLLGYENLGGLEEKAVRLKSLSASVTGVLRWGLSPKAINLMFSSGCLF